MAFVSHGGIGNQVLGILRGQWIAERLGCALVIPPFLRRLDLRYGRRELCRQGLQKEREAIAEASVAYRLHAHLSFESIFQLNPNGSVAGSLAEDIASLTFIPHHCELLSWFHGDASRYSRYLQMYARTTGPHPERGNFTIGSAFHAGVPRGDFGRVFVGLAEGLRRAASAAQEAIVLRTGFPKGRYACLHVPSPDSARAVDGATVEWVRRRVADTLPLYLMSPQSRAALLRVAEMEVCEGAGCVTSSDLLPAGLTVDSRKKLFLEMAVCAMAHVVYLPSTGDVITGGQRQGAKRVGLNSTLQLALSMMARMPALQQARATNSEVNSTNSSTSLDDLIGYLQCNETNETSEEACGGDESLEGEDESFGEDYLD